MARKTTSLALRASGMTAAELHIVARSASSEAQRRETAALERASKLIDEAQEIARNVASTVSSDYAATEIRSAAISLVGAAEHLGAAAACLEQKR